MLSGEGDGRLAFADLNGDGHQDLIEANHSQIVVAIGKGNGEYGVSKSVPVPVSTNPAIASIADLDRDGKLDLVFTGGRMVTLKGAGDGSFDCAVTFPLELGYEALVGDVNEDGSPDVIARRVSDLFFVANPHH
jgi:hypothetical protein